jgi:hypothetical protein
MCVIFSCRCVCWVDGGSFTTCGYRILGIPLGRYGNCRRFWSTPLVRVLKFNNEFSPHYISLMWYWQRIASQPIYIYIWKLNFGQQWWDETWGACGNFVRNLRTLWSPPISLNQERHTKAQSSFYLFIYFNQKPLAKTLKSDRKSSLARPPDKNVAKTHLIMFRSD